MKFWQRTDDPVRDAEDYWHMREVEQDKFSEALAAAVDNNAFVLSKALHEFEINVRIELNAAGFHGVDIPGMDKLQGAIEDIGVE